MRALIAVLPVAIALAGDTAPLENAAKQWASDSAEERDHGSRAVARHLQRELAPIVAAMSSPDPEVRRRARAALEGLLPPRPPEPQAPEPQQQLGAGLIVNQNGAQQIRVVLNAQGQVILAQQDQGEIQQLKANGVMGVPVDDLLLRDQLCLAEGRGFGVIGVDAGSHAARLGIEAYDVLISIDGRAVKQPAEVLKGLAARSPEIKLLRRGKLLTLGAKGEGALGEGK